MTLDLSRIVLASSNSAKLKELGAILSCKNVTLLPQSELIFPMPSRTASVSSRTPLSRRAMPASFPGYRHWPMTQAWWSMPCRVNRAFIPHATLFAALCPASAVIGKPWMPQIMPYCWKTSSRCQRKNAQPASSAAWHWCDSRKTRCHWFARAPGKAASCSRNMARMASAMTRCFMSPTMNVLLLSLNRQRKTVSAIAHRPCSNWSPIFPYDPAAPGTVHPHSVVPAKMPLL